jgi:hypothetical protein
VFVISDVHLADATGGRLSTRERDPIVERASRGQGSSSDENSALL